MAEEQLIKKESVPETEIEGIKPPEVVVDEIIEEADKQKVDVVEMAERIDEEVKENKLSEDLSVENTDIKNKAVKTLDTFNKDINGVVKGEMGDSDGEKEAFEEKIWENKEQPIRSQEPDQSAEQLESNNIENQEKSPEYQESQENPEINPGKLMNEMETSGKDYISEVKKRQKEWEEKPREEKEEGVKEFSEKNIESDPEIKKVMGNVDELKARLKELVEERDKISENRMDMMQKLQEYAEGNIDFSELGLEDKLKTKELLSEFRKTAESALAFEKGDYALEKLEDYEKLLENHEARKINVENLEIIVETIEGLEAYLERFESLAEKEKEAEKEKVKGLIEKLLNLRKEHPTAFKALLATIVIGVAALGLAIGIPLAAKLLEGVSAGVLAEYGPSAIGAGAGLAGLYLSRNSRPARLVRWSAKKAWQGIKLSPWLAIGGAAMLASYLSKGEHWDSFMEQVTGVRVHRWFRTVPEKAK